MSSLTVLEHPLIDVKMTVLRNIETPPHQFRQTLQEIAALMSAEVFAHIKTQTVQVQTPLEETSGAALENLPPCLVSILRAGNGLVNAFLEILPEAAVGHLGMERDPETHTASHYYEKQPSHINQRQIIVVDPMLATGGSAIMALDRLKSHGATDMIFVSLLASPEGVAALRKSHSDVPIITAALDRELNDKGYILPGLGDAGDRIFNT